MYISGTQYNFINRLHQLASSTGDLNTYQLEVDTYTYSGIPSVHVVKKINREFGQTYFNLTLNSTYLSGIYVTTG